MKRRVTTVHHSTSFIRTFKKLPPKLALEVVHCEKIFRNDCFDPQLGTHKLKGKFEGFWSFSINYRYRIVFEFTKQEEALFVAIGDHDVYR